jgi:glyoxylase-like metal-dependent hydrolase (beta-lactamase superfamily II)
MSDSAHTDIPRYTFTLLRAGTFKLDAGSMFGLIPRSVWSRSVPTDDKSRITVAHNCLLLKRHDPAPPSSRPNASTPSFPRLLLIEAGTGDKLDPKMQDVFELEKNPAGHKNAGKPRTIVDALAEHYVTPDQIDAVICSHLHFDHAGGLTRLARPGEKPTWPVPPNDDGGGGSHQTHGCVLTFPNTTIHIQQREWNDAINNRSVMTKTYYPDHLGPIADRIRLTDSPRPYITGLTPDREELPSTPIALRESDPFRRGMGSPAHAQTDSSSSSLSSNLKSEISNLKSGISVFLTPGHTWGQQAIKFQEPDAPHGKGGGGRTIVFVPDVMPTAAHLGAAYSLAYDVEPYTSMLSRRWLLTEAAQHDWVLHLDHEPGHPLFRVKANTKGWFDLIPEPL